MKRKITFLYIFILLTTSIFAQNNANKSNQVSKQKLNSFLWQLNDSNTGIWKDYSKTEYNYGNNLNIAEVIRSDLNSTNNFWQYFDKVEFNYDSDDKLILRYYYMWDNTAGKWDLISKIEYAYDVNDNKIQTIHYDLNSYGNWKLRYKFDFSYDSKENVTLTYRYDWDGGQWKNINKIEYSYNADGEKVLEIDNHWDESTNTWKARGKEELTYDTKGNKILSLDYVWDYDKGQWLAKRKIENTFDIYDNRTQMIEYIWNETIQEYEKHYKEEFTYNTSYFISNIILPFYYYPISYTNMLTLRETYSWETNGWEQRDKGIPNYSEYNTLSVSEINGVKFNIFPNPASENIVFTISNDFNKIKFELFDIQGRKVMSKEIKRNDIINIESLDAGLYLFYLYADEKKQGGKLIKK